MSLLKNWLERKRYDVQYTGNKDEVWKILKEFAPELIMIDVLQIDVIEQLKNNYVARPFLVLLMTGYTFRYINNDIPVDDTIEKPFNLRLLEKKIERLIDKNI